MSGGHPRSLPALAALLEAALLTTAASGQAPAPDVPPVAPASPVVPDGGLADPIPEGAELPPQHLPRLSVELSKGDLAIGEVLKVTVRADALETDDVTVPEQSFQPFEVQKKDRRVAPPKDGRHEFVFELEVQTFDADVSEFPEVNLRVVTGDNQIGTVRTQAQPLTVASLLANEPDAKLKPETEPVVVMEDDYTLLYVLFGVLGALFVAGLTLLVQRYLRRRPKPEPPPPPPRPPWEIAHGKLLSLRRRKQAMLEAGEGVQFVDEVSDAVRECLGGCFGFDGLDTTTEEMLANLRKRRAAVGLQEEARAYLNRCDLVKFAKVNPDQDEVDLILAKAQDIVQLNTPGGGDDLQPPPAHTGGER